MTTPAYHIPVLLQECIEGLRINPNGTYVDVTFGGGGHSRAILEKLGEQGKLLAFDQDKTVEGHLPEDARFMFFNQNFRYTKNFLKIHRALPVQGILADLGISSHQIDEESRGFSTRSSTELLDMRMDKNNVLNAQIILNEYEEKRLAEIFWLYGELLESRKIAARIMDFRKKKSIQTIEDFKYILYGLYPQKKEASFLARVFQALRIEVNQELDALRELLLTLPDILATGGRAVIISYHSLEDRLVKNMFKTGNLEGNIDKDMYGNFTVPFEQIHKKVILPTAEEIARNPRARSAKLRIAEKL